MPHPIPRRPSVRQLGSVLVWGLGVAAAGSGALLVLFAVTERFLGLQALSDGSGEFPWMGAIALAVTLPVVAFVLAMWSRVAFRGVRHRGR